MSQQFFSVYNAPTQMLQVFYRENNDYAIIAQQFSLPPILLSNNMLLAQRPSALQLYLVQAPQIIQEVGYIE